MAPELAIATRGLTKQFDRHVAVNEVELEVASGEVYGLIGPNGAGKTTLIRMLAAAEEPTAGEIELFGRRSRLDQSGFSIKRRLGYLPDDFPLYEELSVWDYLDYFACLYHLEQPRRHRRLREVLELAQLSHKRHSQIATLSRGMKQRLGLARTIVHEPILLLLDEPVSGLDPVSRRQFREVIKILQAAGMTILISSHVLGDLEELCTSVGIMELGYLVESAPLADLYQRLGRQQVVISTLEGSMAALRRELNDHPLVESWEELSREGSGSVRVSFSGDATALAELSRSLVVAGIPLVDFNPAREDLESIFLRMDHQQAS